ncbi:hypothetical protein EDD16DRAFT_1640025 [Pisolithus croceorrhizus]|nr:hypothetical protein EDD16DRAFT_1640025 [Pisolithus croceorrhizus]
MTQSWFTALCMGFSCPVSCWQQPLYHVNLLHALHLYPRPFYFDDLAWLTMLLYRAFGPLRLGELVRLDSDDLREYSQLSPRPSVQFDDSSCTFTVG